MTAIVLVGIAAFFILMGTDIASWCIEQLRYMLRCAAAWFREDKLS